MFHTICQIIPEAHAVLQLIYTNGDQISVDFNSLIQCGGIYAPLADQTYFTQVTIGEKGRFIQWPNELEFCADALWLEGRRGQNEAKETLNYLAM